MRTDTGRGIESRRSRRTRRGLAVLAALTLGLVPAASLAVTPGAIVFDAVMVRPVAAVHTAIGSVFFGLAALCVLPYDLAKSNDFETTQAAWSTFVMAPSIDAYQRPLGEF